MREIVRPEMPDGWMDDTLTPKRWKWYEPACYSFPRRWQRVTQEGGMTMAAYRLFFGLVAHMGWENRVTASLAIVARASGVGARSVPRALRCLEEARLVAVDRSNPTLLHIVVSPFLVWKGRPHLVYDARRVFEEQVAQAQRQAVQRRASGRRPPAAVPAAGGRGRLRAVPSLPAPG